MNPHQVLIQVRATLFIPQFLGYSAENSSKYQTLLPEAKVSVVNLNENSPWQLINENYQISFLPNRVDVRSMGASEKIEKKNDFIKTVQTVFSKIMETEGISATRLAYAPSYAWDDSSDFKGSLYLNSLTTRHQFEGVDADENEVRNRYLVKRRIGNVDAEVNHIVDISAGTRQTREGNALETFPTIICELDINNRPEEAVRLTRDDMISFYNQVLDWEQSLLQVYL